jgi:hypothetical protein
MESKDMRLKLLLFLALFLGLGAVAHADKPTITVSTNNTPLDRKALHDLSKEAFRRIGVDFKLVSLPSERSLHSANLGEVDGEGLRVAGPETASTPTWCGARALHRHQLRRLRQGCDDLGWTRAGTA